MTRLERILSPYEVRGEMGSAKTFDRAYLRTALTAASRQTAAAFWLAMASQVGVFFLTAWLAVANAANPKALSFVLAGGGGGIGACGWAMVRLWKEKVATDLTVALVASLNESTAISVLNVVLEAFRAQPGLGRRSRKPGPSTSPSSGKAANGI